MSDRIEKPTEYKKWLETLYDKYKGTAPQNKMSWRMARLQLILDTDEVNSRFEVIRANLSKCASLDLDIDVDYKEWSKPEKWLSALDEGNDFVSPSLSGNALNYDNKTMAKEFAYKIVEYFNVDQKDKDGKDIKYFPMFSEYRTALEILGGDAVSDDRYKKAIQGAVTKLCMTLADIYYTLENTTPKAKEALYKSLVSPFKKYYAAANKEYEEWKQHECLNDSDIEQYIEKRESIIVDLLNNPLLHKLNKRCSTAMLEIYRREFDLAAFEEEVHNINSQYTRFRELFEYEHELYTPKVKELANFIFEKRKATDSYDDVFNFIKQINLISLVQNGMKGLKKVEKVYQLPPGFKESLVFHERFDVRRIYSKLYEFATDGKTITAQRHWYLVYRFFEKEDWLYKKMQSKFRDEICQCVGKHKPSKEDFKSAGKLLSDIELCQMEGTNLSIPKDYINLYKKLKSTFVEDLYLLPGKLSSRSKRTKFT